jgi:hypothetical protein
MRRLGAQCSQSARRCCRLRTCRARRRRGMMARGARSAGLFQLGGVVVDGRGLRDAAGRRPRRISDAWRVLLVCDPGDVGLHSRTSATPSPNCRLSARDQRRSLPAVLVRICRAAGAAYPLARGDPHSGDRRRSFRPGAGRRRSPAARSGDVARLLADGATGGGQTSWGRPASPSSSDAAARLLGRHGAGAPGSTFRSLRPQPRRESTQSRRSRRRAARAQPTPPHFYYLLER